jgi:hypothetical protein
MMTYNIEPDQSQLKEAQELFQFLGGNSTDATRIAVNKAARRMRLVARKEIRNDVRLALSYVSERLVVKAAKKGGLTAKIETPSRGLRLTKFSTDPNIAAEGVQWIKPPLSAVRQKGGDTPPPFMVQVKPGGATKPVRGDTSKSKPFVIVGKGSRALLLVQRNAGGKLDALYGPSLSQVFSSVRERIIPDAEKELVKQMGIAMNTLLKKQFPAEEEAGLPE